MDDNDIIKLFESGDESAIELCTKKYVRELKTFSYNLTGSMEDAEECVNEAMLLAWKNIPERCPQNLRAFLYKITRNLSLDMVRKRSAQKRNAATVALDELGECIPDKNDHVSLIEDASLTQEIEYWLKEYDREKRAIFIRRYFLMESGKEIAKNLRISQGTVFSTLSRMRSSLKQYLQDKGYIL